jgi:hypothetical protein
VGIAVDGGCEYFDGRVGAEGEGVGAAVGFVVPAFSLQGVGEVDGAEGTGVDVIVGVRQDGVTGSMGEEELGGTAVLEGGERCVVQLVFNVGEHRVSERGNGGLLMVDMQEEAVQAGVGGLG